MSDTRFAWAASILIIVAWGFDASGAHAQSGEADIGEVAGSAGVASGGGIGAQAFVSGGVGLAFSRYGMGLIETSFLPLGQQTIQPWPAPFTVNHSYLLDFAFNIHIRIPVKHRWAPYAIVGTGLLWDLVQQRTTDSTGVTTVRGYNQFNGVLNTGGGLRYYFGQKWGIRPEVKVLVSKQVYTCVSVGVFYVIPANWP